MENILYKILNTCKIFISSTRTFHGIVDMEIANSNYKHLHRIKKHNNLTSKGKKVDGNGTGRSKIVEIY